MNDQAAAIALGRRIDLTREPDLVLGGVVIQPTACEVTLGDQRLRLQPRVMEVLVALARAGGQPVSRETLLSVCWGEVTVGEDALNRCIQRLRRLSEAEANGAFAIETIPRLGYRLAVGHVVDTTTPAVQPLLAVLAFDNLSGDPEMLWFTDGISEEVLHTVARATDLKVAGRGSSFQFRGADKAAARVAAAIGATHVLDGSVRRSGTRVRIAAHLIECTRETTLWSDRFDRDLTDIFTLQDEIAAAVATALKVVFEPTPKSEPIDPSAYELYLKGHTLGAGSFNDPKALATAAGLFRQATGLAPRFARAWSLLAMASMFQLRVHGTEQPYAAMRAEVVQAAEAALTLDPRLGAAYIALAGLEPVAHYIEREALFKKALSVAPNDPNVIAGVAAFYFQIGRLGEAFEHAERGFNLDPSSMTAANTYGCVLVGTGRYWESRDLWDRILVAWPDAGVFLGNAIGFAGSARDWERLEDLVRLAKERHMYNDYIRQITTLYRNINELSSSYRTRFLQYALDEFAKTGNVREGILGNMCQLGMADEAFDLIERASFDYVWDPEQLWPGAFNSSDILSPALYEGFMRDARFPRLCAKLGLCDYWVKTERWPDCAEDGVLPYDFKAECRRLWRL